MAIVEIQVRSDIPKYELRVDLDGTTYTLAFAYIKRKDRWIMDVKTSDGINLVMGIPVLVNQDFLVRYKDERLPSGILFAINIEDEFVESGREELSDSVKVLYQESA